MDNHTYRYSYDGNYSDALANLYPHFQRDADGNIYARYANGATVTIYHANRNYDPYTDGNTRNDSAGQTIETADDGNELGGAG